jgi:hypothetical protein
VYDDRGGHLGADQPQRRRAEAVALRERDAECDRDHHQRPHDGSGERLNLAQHGRRLSAPFVAEGLPTRVSV